MIIIGIDFGTTKTMAAWVNPKTGHQEVINLGEEHNYIPTTVFLDKGGSMHYGEEADDLAADEPDRYARGFKMKLGSGSPALMCFQDGRPCTYTARQLTAAFLRHVRQLCEERACFGSVDAAVITRPVNFSPAQVEDLRLAAEEAGFRDVTFVTEPEAAGYAFCRLSPESAFHGSALIVDWGGGTLDMSIVERAGNKVKTDRTRVSGENMMGGEMFDAYLWQYVTSCLSGKGTDINIQPAAVIHQAQVQVRKAKESLSKRDSKDLRFATSGGSTPPVPVRRADFESLIGQDIQNAAGMARLLVQKTKQAGSKPEMLLLVGGTSLIPLVRSQMESQTGLPARQWQYTREAVAIGAALWNWKQTEQKTPIHKIKEQELAPEPQPKTSIVSAYTQFEQHADECMRKCPVDFQGAAEWYVRGYKAGDLNCTYDLANCLLEGRGTPRDYQQAMILAKHLEECNCPLAYGLLGDIYSKGQGVSLDVTRGRNYYERVLRECVNPLPGIDDSVRHMALFLASSGLGRKEEEKHWIHEYAQDEHAIWAESMEAMAVIESVDSLSAAEKKQIRNLLEKGITKNDPMAMFAKAMFIGDGNLFQGSEQELVKLLQKAAFCLPLPHLLLALAMRTGDKETYNHLIEVVHLGTSCIPSEHELNCRISVNSNLFGAFFRVYERSVAGTLIENKRLEDIVTCPLSPRIVVINTNNVCIRSFSLRVCISAQQYDNTFQIAESINPGESVDILFSDYDIPLDNRMILEVHSNGKFSRIDFDDLMNVPDFIDLDGAPPPLMLAWEKGFFGGYKLFILNMGEQPVSGINVIKNSGAKTGATVLQPGESVSWGWSEFSDSTGLAEKELFYVLSDGYLPIAGEIHTTQNDDSSTGIGTLAKIGGLALLGALGAS